MYSPIRSVILFFDALPKIVERSVEREIFKRDVAEAVQDCIFNLLLGCHGAVFLGGVGLVWRGAKGGKAFEDEYRGMHCADDVPL